MHLSGIKFSGHQVWRLRNFFLSLILEKLVVHIFWLLEQRTRLGVCLYYCFCILRSRFDNIVRGCLLHVKTKHFIVLTNSVKETQHLLFA